jgi:hypothetical protein
LWRFAPPQFGQGSLLRNALLPAQTVSYSRNVMRNFGKICYNKYCQKTFLMYVISGGYMHKNYLLILLLGWSVTLYGQNSVQNDKKYSFQVKPVLCSFITVATIVSNNENEKYHLPIFFFFFFQYALSNRFTVFVNSSFVSGFYSFLTERQEVIGNTIYYYDRNYETSYINLTSGLMYRPYSTGLTGMYIGVFPIVGFSFLMENKDKFLNLGLMLECGKEWIFKSGFTFTLGGGFSKYYPVPFSDNKYSYDNNIINFYGVPLFFTLPIDIRIRASIGYSF